MPEARVGRAPKPAPMSPNAAAASPKPKAAAKPKQPRTSTGGVKPPKPQSVPKAAGETMSGAQAPGTGMAAAPQPMPMPMQRPINMGDQMRQPWQGGGMGVAGGFMKPAGPAPQMGGMMTNQAQPAPVPPPVAAPQQPQGASLGERMQSFPGQIQTMGQGGMQGLNQGIAGGLRQPWQGGFGR